MGCDWYGMKIRIGKGRNIMEKIVITLRLPLPILSKYKELGKGYTSIMAHILCEYIQEHGKMN
jgi:uncharacterized protein (DUF4415 family)